MAFRVLKHLRLDRTNECHNSIVLKLYEAGNDKKVGVKLVTV